MILNTISGSAEELAYFICWHCNNRLIYNYSQISKYKGACLMVQFSSSLLSMRK